MPARHFTTKSGNGLNENNNTYSCSSLHDEAVYIDFLEIAEFLEKPIGWGATMGP